MKQEVFSGFSHLELQDAFELVADRADWKAPIKTTIRAQDWKVVQAAIIYFTSTIPQKRELAHDKVEVTAQGYRVGPAGDH